jgi:hypothetical protein
MCLAVDIAVVILLHPERRDGVELGVDAPDRQSVPGGASLQCPSDDLASTKRRLSGEQEAHPSADAAHGLDANLPEAEHQQGSQGAQDLSVSAQGTARGSPQPSLSRRHHLSPDAAWVPLPRRYHGLAYAQGSGLAHLEHIRS